MRFSPAAGLNAPTSSCMYSSILPARASQSAKRLMGMLLSASSREKEMPYALPSSDLYASCSLDCGGHRKAPPAGPPAEQQRGS